MKIRKINIYSFDELSKEAQAKALEKFRYINTDFSDWSDPITEGAKETLTPLGYEDAHILFSGFGSQGDGACFTASVNIGEWLKAHSLTEKYAELFKYEADYKIVIEHKWRYYYSTSTDVWLDEFDEPDAHPEAEKQAQEVLALVEKEREELGNKFYRDLSDYYDELTEDEAIRDTILVNEYEFLANGELAPSI